MDLSNQFIEIFNYIGEKFGVMVDWSSENIMPYLTDLCTRIITNEIYTSIAWIAIWILIIVVSWALVNKIKDESLIVLAIFMSVIGFGTIVSQTFDIIEAKTIPESIIIEKIKQVQYILE